MSVDPSPSPETFRLALLMLKEHGDDAEDQVADCADNALERGDALASAAWARFARALEELRRAQPRLSDGRA